MDREKQDTHLLLIKATEDCSRFPKNQSFFDSDDDTQLKVIVKVLDVNDNAPKFIHRVFTGGVSTATSFGTKFMQGMIEIINEIIVIYISRLLARQKCNEANQTKRINWFILTNFNSKNNHIDSFMI